MQYTANNLLLMLLKKVILYKRYINAIKPVYEVIVKWCVLITNVSHYCFQRIDNKLYFLPSRLHSKDYSSCIHSFIHRLWFIQSTCTWVITTCNICFHVTFIMYPYFILILTFSQFNHDFHCFTLFLLILVVTLLSLIFTVPHFFILTVTLLYWYFFTIPQFFNWFSPSHFIYRFSPSQFFINPQFPTF